MLLCSGSIQDPTKFLESLLHATNLALTDTYYICVAMASLLVIVAVSVGWNSIKGMKQGAVAA